MPQQTPTLIDRLLWPIRVGVSLVVAFIRKLIEWMSGRNPPPPAPIDPGPLQSQFRPPAPTQPPLPQQPAHPAEGSQAPGDKP